MNNTALIIAGTALYVVIVLVVARFCGINGRQSDAEIEVSKQRRKVRAGAPFMEEK